MAGQRTSRPNNYVLKSIYSLNNISLDLRWYVKPDKELNYIFNNTLGQLGNDKPN